MFAGMRQLNKFESIAVSQAYGLFWTYLESVEAASRGYLPGVDPANFERISAKATEVTVDYALVSRLVKREHLRRAFEAAEADLGTAAFGLWVNWCIDGDETDPLVPSAVYAVAQSLMLWLRRNREGLITGPEMEMSVI